MKVPIGEHMLILKNCHAYVCSTEDDGADDGEIRLCFLKGGLCQTIDLSIDEALRFRDILSEGITEAFEVCDELRCPACRYSWEDAKMHGDHRICRRYPFFPGESGKSHAT